MHLYTPLTIRPGTKAPRHRGWSDPTYNAPIQDGDNVGYRLDNLTVIDADGQEAVDYLETTDASLTPYVSESRAGHRAYWFRGLLPGGTYHWSLPDGARGGEVRSGLGAQCVVPPSIHPSTGKPYVWLGPELKGDPKDLTPLFPDDLPPRFSPSGTLTPEGALDVSEALSGVSEGMRDDTLMRLAARWRGLNLTLEEALVLARQAAAACDPPFSDRVAEDKVRRAFEKYQPNGHETVVLENEELDYNTLTIDGLMALPKPTWLIHPYLATGSMVMLAAPANTGKTFLALDWALKLSEGHRVLYVALEGLPGMQDRVKAWQVANKGARPDLLFAGPNVTLSLLDTPSVQRMCDFVSIGYDLIVIDNLGEAFPGNENDSQDVGRGLFNAKTIQRAAGATLLTLHNFGHEAKRSRGHSKLLDAHDTIIYADPIEESNDKGIRLRCGKERYAERFAPHAVALEPVGPAVVVKYGVVSFGADKILEYIQRHPKCTVSIMETAMEDMTKRQIRKRLAELEDLGSIEVDDSGKAYTYQVKEK